MSIPSPTLDLSAVRASFPALASGYIFADNAGGSQCLASVAHAISDYLLRTNVQLGADYSISVESTKRVIEGGEAARTLFNAQSADEVVFGSSSTQVAENLARGIEKDMQDGDEFVITGEHEANGGPWKKLAARRGLTLKYWRPTPTDPNNPYSVALKIDELIPLITPKTRLVTFTACSNILGSIVPVKEVIKAIREAAKIQGAPKVEVCVDCVAYAPHRRIDVQDWDVDYCFFSFYKVYGAHIAALYARSNSLRSSVTSIAHHFLSVDDKSYKLQGPSGPGYELTYSTTAVLGYLLSLTPANSLSDSYEAIKAHEHSLVERLLGYLKSQAARGVQIVGQATTDSTRAPTISFLVRGERPLASRAVVAAFDKHGGVGIRYGHFYAYTLIDELEPKIDVVDAVVRISLVHYNTVEEVDKIIEILQEVLA